MAELGLPPTAVLNGANREPLWPAGVIGSLTHCDGYRAAALARAGSVASLGIDAEPNAALPDGVLPTIARPEEIPRLERLLEQFPETCWDRLLFSAKESVYKAWFPLARCWLGFEEATLDFDPGSDGFGVALHQTGPLVGGRPLTAMRGRWLVRDGLIVTSVVVP
jgi:4'-phosphopantetheinyl transferase EntD